MADEAVQSKSFDLIKQFASEVVDFGKENQLEIVAEYGESLLMQVDNFDVDMIDHSLNSFSKVIEEIEQYKPRLNE